MSQPGGGPPLLRHTAVGRSGVVAEQFIGDMPGASASGKESLIDRVIAAATSSARSVSLISARLRACGGVMGSTTGSVTVWPT